MTSRKEALNSAAVDPQLPSAVTLAARSVGILAFGLSILLLYQLVCIARADWLSKQRTRETILAAIHLFPDNSLFYRFWAEIEPSEAVVALRQAAVVNPLNPDIRIELGLAAERAGDLAEAEASLIKAVDLERTGAPRGLLAEFYFRHRQAEKFWPVARDALDHLALDTPTLLEDCWALTSDSELILQQAIPNRPAVLIDYLKFLLSRKRLDAAAPVSDRIMSLTRGAEAAQTMFDYCDRLIENNSPSQAIRVWNWLCREKFVPYGALEPEAGRSLTNGGFAFAPLSRGFDWRPSPNGGLYVEYTKRSSALDVTFTGNQPEQCEILSQFVLLQPNRTYRLRVRYTMSDINSKSGLIWRIQVAAPNQDLLKNSGVLSGGSGEQELSAPFEVPADTAMARLVLSYERVKGTVRIEGSVEIQHVDLAFEQK